MSTAFEISNNSISATEGFQTSNNATYWPYDSDQYHSYWTYPSTYTIQSPDKAELLKAWLDGYLTDRKMTEKALKRIREKIEEFSQS